MTQENLLELAVTVQPLCGATFHVELQRKSTVRNLKSEVAGRQGIPWQCQEIFLLAKEDEAPLADGDEIVDACTVVLCIKDFSGGS